MMKQVRALVAFVVITYLFFMVIPMAVLALVDALRRVIGGPVWPAQPLNYLGALAVLIFGGYWVVESNLLLLKVGRGTSLEVAGRAVAPTTTLVRSGVYSHVRNPMVFGYFTAFGLGIPLLQQTPVGLALYPILLVLYGLYLKVWEERNLVARFGDDYRAYCREVPMLIPALRSHTPSKEVRS